MQSNSFHLCCFYCIAAFLLLLYRLFLCIVVWLFFFLYYAGEEPGLWTSLNGVRPVKWNVCTEIFENTWNNRLCLWSFPSAFKYFTSPGAITIRCHIRTGLLFSAHTAASSLKGSKCSFNNLTQHYDWGQV